jgi:hypothetical protein
MQQGKPPSIEKKSITEATKEAEQRPLDFNPKERAELIMQMLNDIPTWINRGDSEKDIKERIPDFVEKYPELFKKIIKKEDLSPINTMLTMLDRIAEGQISQHKASVVVGQKLVDKYVMPSLKSSSKK